MSPNRHLHHIVKTTRFRILGGGIKLSQPYPIHNRRPRRRQEQYYKPFPTYNFYDQQLSDFQSGQNVNSTMYQQQYQKPYQHPYQQHYQQPYQSSFQPLYGSGSNGNINAQFMNAPYPTPYPKPAPYFKQQPSGLQTVISQFKKSDGQLDLNKMMDTAGQMMSAVNQMGGLFKGVTSMFK
jgi:hypothetical protein